jgi:hypothetical protein
LQGRTGFIYGLAILLKLAVIYRDYPKQFNKAGEIIAETLQECGRLLLVNPFSGEEASLTSVITVDSSIIALKDDLDWFFDDDHPKNTLIPEKAVPSDMKTPQDSTKSLTDVQIIKGLSHLLPESDYSFHIIPSRASQNPAFHYFLDYFLYYSTLHLWKFLLPAHFTLNPLSPITSSLSSYKLFSDPFLSSSSCYYYSEMSSNLSLLFKHFHQLESKSELSRSAADDLGNDFPRFHKECPCPDGALSLSFTNSLQCKYLKGLSLTHSLIAPYTVMINSYYEDLRTVYERKLTQQKQSHSQAEFHYYSVQQIISSRGAVRCQRILCLWVDSDYSMSSEYLENFTQERNYVLKETSFISDSNNVILNDVNDFQSYHHQKRSYFTKLKDILSSLSLDLVVLYQSPSLSLDNAHSSSSSSSLEWEQFKDLCEECSLLFLSITSSKDFDTFQRVLPNSDYYFSENYNCAFLSLTEENILHQELAVYLFAPLVSTNIYEEILEIGEFHYSAQSGNNCRNSFEFDETNEEIMKYGNENYNCIVFLQLLDGDYEGKENCSYPPEQCTTLGEYLQFHTTRGTHCLSCLFTSSTLSYLQFIFHSFFNNLNKIRLLLESNGSNLLFGSGIPELLQTVLIQQKCNLLSQRMIRKKDEEVDDKEKTSEEADLDYSICLEICKEFCRHQENYSRQIMLNCGVSQNDTETIISKSKNALQQFYTMNAMENSLANPKFQELLKPAIILDLNENKEKTTSKFVYDLQNLKWNAFQSAFLLVKNIVNVRIIDNE